MTCALIAMASFTLAVAHGYGEPSADLAHQVAEQGAEFVPKTLRYLGVPENALMDAAQDVFLVALRRVSDFEGRSSLRTWLYGICVKVAHGNRRRSKSARESLVEVLPELEIDAPQEADLERAHWRRQLNALLDELDDAQRAVFVLYEIEGLTMKEVADALACPLQTAYFRHKSATKRVLDAFRQSGAMEEA
jgi:RNA polymerase sigma-70 factor, ECF subfamily